MKTLKIILALVKTITRHFSMLLSFVSLLIFSLSINGSDVRAQPAETNDLVRSSVFVNTNDFSKSFDLIIMFEIKKDWHLYWKNPGEAGLAPKIKLTLPEGYSHDEILFPTPKKFEMDGVIGFGYSSELLLTTKITPLKQNSYEAAHIPGISEDVFLKVEIKWLACEKICVPGSETLLLPKKISNKEVSIGKKLLEKATLLQPQDLSMSPFTVASATYNAEGERKAKVSLQFVQKSEVNKQQNAITDFFLELIHGWIIDYKSVTIKNNGSETDIEFYLTKQSQQNELKEFGFVFISSDNKGYFHKINVLNRDGNSEMIQKDMGNNDTNLWVMLLFALLGGFILNFMPCVLPVVSLKILSFSKHAEYDSKKTALNGVSYVSGIVVSFWILAAVIVILKSIGAKIGWGFQFQSPFFVLAMLFIVWVFGLNLLGVFELDGFAVSGKIGNLLSRNDFVGSFFNGVLTTTLATPCTAPFLSVALGFAFSQSNLVLFLFFSVIAIGLGLPYLILSLNKKWMRFIPKPGNWMLIFKQLMGFLLLATGIWLLSILEFLVGGSSVIFTLIWLLGISIAAWVLGRFVFLDTPLKQKLMAWSVAIFLVAASAHFIMTFIIEKKSTLSEKQVNVHTEWLPFSNQIVESEIQKGNIVFVDFTAEWCFTCKINEKLVIDSDDVKEKMKELNVSKVKADWTNYDETITTALEKFNRVGIPFYLIYSPKRPDKPILLSEILTTSELINGLEAASK